MPWVAVKKRLHRNYTSHLRIIIFIWIFEDLQSSLQDVQGGRYVGTK